jgi:predicted transcriptional regulator
MTPEQFSKLLLFEYERLSSYKDEYSRLQKEFQEILGPNYKYIVLENIEYHIKKSFEEIPKVIDNTDEFQYPQESKTKKLLKLKIKYLDLYDRVKNAFLRFYYEIPENAVMHELNRNADIIHNLLNSWNKALHEKFLIPRELLKLIKENKNGN